MTGKQNIKKTTIIIRAFFARLQVQGLHSAAGWGLLACMSCVGCFSSSPEIRYYDFRPSFAGLNMEEKAGADLGAVQLLEVRVPEPLDDRRIFYRSSRFEAGHYEYHRWIRSPSEALADELVRFLAAANCFSQVAGPDDPLIPDAAKVRVWVDDLNEIDTTLETDDAHKDQAWSAKVSFRIQIMRTAHDEGGPLRIEEEEPVRMRSAKGVAIAINTALNRALSQSVAAIVEKCRSSAFRQEEQDASEPGR